MAIDTNFNLNPYYDDYNENKNFLRILFKPGFAVQARELTQVQSIFQKQVERMGEAAYRNGTVVTGAETFAQEATYIKLNSTYSGLDIVANNFIGQSILSTDDSKRAEVVKVYEADPGTGDPITLMVKQLYGEPFVATETIKTNEASPYFADISPSVTAVGTGQLFSVTEGVFYYEGFFIKNAAQTIATSKYTTTLSNVRIGFEVSESIVTSDSDTTLLDPAQDASNYQAPGADRYKIDLILATRTLGSTDFVKFFEISRVEEGVLTRISDSGVSAIIENELARRTFDESGHYTVRPFLVSLQTNEANTANMDVILSPGKAYVYGYEFETNSPTTITVEKPRTSENVINRKITADYGNFVYTSNTIGNFSIDHLAAVELHCVPNSSINITSTAAISNTKIGTARVKSVEFDSATDTANTTTYVYKAFLFDINVNNSITGNVVSYSAATPSITIGNYSTVTNAYRGAKIKITTGPGTGEAPREITAYDGSTKVLTLSKAFTATLTTASKFSIDFEFNDADSMATFNGGTVKINAGDIDSRSKSFATPYTDAILLDTKFEPLIFPLGQGYIKANSIADFSYTQKRIFSNVAFSGSVTSVLSPISSGETLSTATSDSAKLEKYQIIVTSVGTSPYTLYQTVPVANVTTVDTTNKQITVLNANNMTANIISTIDYTLASGNPAKTKSIVYESATIQTSGGQSINTNGVIVYSANGQTTIEANNIIKTPNELQSLYVPDVYQLISVYDFNGTAVSNTGYNDVTSRYTLNNGQRDSHYDHASIQLKAGLPAPKGPIVVRYRAYSSSTGGGFYSADSYPDYGIIPSHISTSGTIYALRDCLDFRPVRKAATAAIGTSVVFDTNPSTTGAKIPKYGSDLIMDFSYYLPRIDKIALNRNKYFEVIKGIPSINPVEPKDKQDTMNLYILGEQPYVANTSDIKVTAINNRRYTMKDISVLDKRINNLEYYTSLSLLEQDAINQNDATASVSLNLQRFKNGIIVDSFKGHSVGDVTAVDYKASIDVRNNELHPTFNITSRMLNFDSSNSTNFVQNGPFITVPSTSSIFVNQILASKSLNINPFNLVNYIGKITLNPTTDVWVDQNRKPDVTVNIGGDKDAWAFIEGVANDSAFAYEWGSWQTVWNGTTFQQGERIGDGRIVNSATGNFQRVTETTTTKQTRTGVKSTLGTETITQSIGDRVVDVSIIPYMRAKTILFTASDFQPNTILYPFFDNNSVEKYVARANRFILASGNLGYRTTTAQEETVRIFNNSTSANLGTAIVVSKSNNSAYVVNINASSAFNAANMNLIGNTSATSIRISGYEHFSGLVVSATSTTIVLRADATGANNEVLYGNTSNSNIVSIVGGTGAGQQRTISSYVAGTRTLTVSSAWTTTPDTSSIYSIGRLTTSKSGDVAGIFNLPASVFRVGEKTFRLIDNVLGDIPSSSSNGDASFYAQGLLQTLENSIISTIQPTLQRTSVRDDKVTTTTRTTDSPVAGWWDPLAQSFLISPSQYSQGMYVEKIRVCFKSKHDTAPVTLQVRPMVNGYPSSTVIYPYGTVVLRPDQVNVTDSPDLDDSSKYTDFVFETPIYMLPGEHSFVLLSNSNGYEAYVAETGKLDLVSGLQISEQPYAGYLFKSQNGSTWQPEENLDMMFRIYRKNFSTTPAILQFLVDKPASNVPFDLLNLTTSQIELANTSVNYSFASEKSTGGISDYYNIIPNENYETIDIDGRRVLNPTTGNTTFVLRTVMSTINPQISPVLDLTRFSGIFVENILNNLPLSNNDFYITNQGTGYSVNTTVTITGGNGAGANAYAVANATSGGISSIVIDVPGSGYTKSPTITIAPPSSGTTAVAVYNGEDKKSGGNSATRYMTRRVTLTEGFDSSDLRVYLTGYKPPDSNILVYYKLLSKSDPEPFDTKEYQLMTEIGNSNFVSLSKLDYRELTFAPGINNTPNNSISYTTTAGSTFKSFITFSIKIVMIGTNTTDVPKVKDVRAVALPGA
jgi:hypothetical protein